jgi:hypothetical protein
MTVRRAVGTRKHDRVAVRIGQPNFPVIGSAVVWRRGIAVFGEGDLCVHVCDPFDRLVEIIDFEPQENAVAIRKVAAVADRSMIMLGLEAVKLKDEISVRHEALVYRAAMIAAAAEQLLVPSAASFDIRHGD